ncbi:MAG: LPS export ABC transporter periplasmic protein LptC [Bacteroidetes bacterium CG12_big_fil_rev_8_21_14_0_65_60_17]|nr:MAG: LPS export ABC transporter periplasmic protein LptC [Bacteroidetes bacterium CG12_big_fil_rev_8_21_14_0_65_60_17]
MIELDTFSNRFRAAGLRLSVAALLVVSACAPHERAVTVETVMSEGDPDQEAWGTRLLIMESGYPRLTLTADYMARFEAPDSTYMVLARVDSSSRRVEVQIHDDTGGERALVVANEVVYVESGRRFQATGRVVATTQDGRHVESEHLSWSEASGRVSTPGYATITTPTQTMSGWGLDADEALTDMRLSRVSGSVLPGEQQP